MSVSVRTKNPIRIKEEAAPFSSEQRSLTQTLVFGVLKITWWWYPQTFACMAPPGKEKNCLHCQMSSQKSLVGRYQPEPCDDKGNSLDFLATFKQRGSICFSRLADSTPQKRPPHTCHKTSSWVVAATAAADQTENRFIFTRFTDVVTYTYHCFKIKICLKLCLIWIFVPKMEQSPKLIDWRVLFPNFIFRA